MTIIAIIAGAMPQSTAAVIIFYYGFNKKLRLCEYGIPLEILSNREEKFRAEKKPVPWRATTRNGNARVRVDFLVTCEEKNFIFSNSMLEPP